VGGDSSLVRHHQLPSWIFKETDGKSNTATETEVFERMKEHIAPLLHHFTGNVYCRDVVNEAISDGSRAWRSDRPSNKVARSSTGDRADN
jgi:endo-1,4-beta-xylanase